MPLTFYFNLSISASLTSAVIILYAISALTVKAQLPSQQGLTMMDFVYILTHLCSKLEV